MRVDRKWRKDRRVFNREEIVEGLGRVLAEVVIISLDEERPVWRERPLDAGADGPAGAGGRWRAKRDAAVLNFEPVVRENNATLEVEQHIACPGNRISDASGDGAEQINPVAERPSKVERILVCTLEVRSVSPTSPTERDICDFRGV